MAHTTTLLPGEDLSGYLARLNLMRCPGAAAAVLLYACIGLAVPAFYKTPSLWVGFAVVCAAGAAYLGWYWGWYKRQKHPQPKRLRWVYLAFWGSLCAGALPYCALDARAGSVPVNTILLCCAMMAVPVFERRECVLFFALFGAAQLVPALALKAPLPYFLYAGASCFFAAWFSLRTHGQYIDLATALQAQNRTDPLTGVLNRSGGMERLESLCGLCARHGRVCAFYMVDIDFFKEYNDAFGHRAGDEALVAAADCLRRCFGRRVDVICRYGGDEFLAAASLGHAQDAVRLAERLVCMMRDKKLEAARRDVSAFVTLSVGVAVHEPDGARMRTRDMLGVADKALYEVKRTRRGTVCVRRAGETAPQR